MLLQNPAELDDWLSDLNPDSKVVIPEAYAEPSLHSAAVGDRFQFERLGKSQKTTCVVDDVIGY